MVRPPTTLEYIKAKVEEARRILQDVEDYIDRERQKEAA